MKPPIGYNDAGEPVEEVVTTASRLRPGTWSALAGAIALVLGFTYLGYTLADPADRRGQRRSTRVRAARARRTRVDSRAR